MTCDACGAEAVWSVFPTYDYGEPVINRVRHDHDPCLRLCAAHLGAGLDPGVVYVVKPTNRENEND